MPKGIGMQITRVNPSHNFFPGKQRFIIEFLVNRELTSEELYALFGSMDGLTDDIETFFKGCKIEKDKAKNYKIHNLIFIQEKKQDYVVYRVGFIGEKNTDKNDIDMRLQSTIKDSINHNLELLWCDIWEVKKFPLEEKTTEVIASISEDKLLNLLNKNKTEVPNSSQR